MSVIYFFIALVSCLIAGICGIGGGVIMKPIISFLGYYDTISINYLTVTTLLVVYISSIVSSWIKGVKVEFNTIGYLPIGTILGGALGKIFLLYSGSDIALLQSICLAIINMCVLLYLVFKNRINTVFIRNTFFIIFLGFVLGTIASFLGIGGGPIYIVALHYFYSMQSKDIIKNSMLLIFLSHTTSLIITLVTNSIPDVENSILLFMCIGGVIGGFVGRKITQRTSERVDERLLIIVIFGLLMLGGFNIYNY